MNKSKIKIQHPFIVEGDKNNELFKSSNKKILPIYKEGKEKYRYQKDSCLQ